MQVFAYSFHYSNSNGLQFFLVSIWAAVDQGLSDRIAAAIGHPPVKPLQVKSAAEALNFRHNIGAARNGANL